MMLRIAALLLCGLIVAPDAAAWGPRARKAIALAALQLVRREAPDAFIAGDVRYEQDLMRGAVDGSDAISQENPLNNDFQTVDAIGSQIQLLREARARGAGSHFAYRMGVLSAVIADVMLPYGFAFTESEEVLRDQVREDIEAHVNEFSYSSTKRTFYYVRSPRLYFEAKRSFFHDDRELVANEYARGQGYEGFLSQAAQAYFQRSIEAVADVWYTVFREKGGPIEVKPSSRQLALYYIAEIGYLLDVMKNMDYANRAYGVFKEVEPTYWMAYVQIGDLFYNVGTEEARTRGVDEWKIAQRVPGEARTLASRRLSDHFIGEGERLFLKSEGIDAQESDLPDALRAFQHALEFDRTSDAAARRISETSVAINARKQQFEMQQKFIDNANGIIKFAERSRLDQDFGGALLSYDQALLLVDLITTDFKDLSEAAREMSSSINKEKKSVISDVLDAANEIIEKGDQQMIVNNYSEAIKLYRMVEPVVSVIPGAEGSINAQRKMDLIDTANGQIADAESGLKRAQESQTQQEKPANPFGN